MRQHANLSCLCINIASMLVGLTVTAFFIGSVVLIHDAHDYAETSLVILEP